jgi:hypothetical protein
MLVIDVVKREVPLLVFRVELALVHPHIGEGSRDLARAIGGERIQHHDVIGERQPAQAFGDVVLLVARQDDHTQCGWI